MGISRARRHNHSNGAKPFFKHNHPIGHNHWPWACVHRCVYKNITQLHFSRWENQKKHCWTTAMGCIAIFTVSFRTKCNCLFGAGAFRRQEKIDSKVYVAVCTRISLQHSLGKGCSVTAMVVGPPWKSKCLMWIPILRWMVQTEKRNNAERETGKVKGCRKEKRNSWQPKIFYVMKRKICNSCTTEIISMPRARPDSFLY